MHDEEQQLQVQQPDQRQPDNLDQEILRHVKHILANKNTQFILEHQHDTLEQLSAYLQACMEDLGHPPARVEVIGGEYLEYRFGSWIKALRSVYTGKVSEHLKNPPSFANRKIVRDLYETLAAQGQGKEVQG